MSCNHSSQLLCPYFALIDVEVLTSHPHAFDLPGSRIFMICTHTMPSMTYTHALDCFTALGLIIKTQQPVTGRASKWRRWLVLQCATELGCGHNGPRVKSPETVRGKTHQCSPERGNNGIFFSYTRCKSSFRTRTIIYVIMTRGIWNLKYQTSWNPKRTHQCPTFSSRKGEQWYVFCQSSSV